MSRAAAALLTTLLLSPAAEAVDYVVTRYDDPPPGGCAAGDCSLREAILASNTNAGPDRILLSAGSYYVLGSAVDDTGVAGDLDVTGDLEIVGAGATMTSIDGDIFSPGIEEPLLDVWNADLQLRDLTLIRGESGGVWVRGSATIERCEIAANGLAADRYGVRIEPNSTATIVASTLAGNGRGLLVMSSIVDLTNVTLYGDRALEAGIDSLVTCTQCTVDDAASASPAAFSSDSQIEFVNSIVSGACATASGGAVESLGGNVESPGATCGFTLGTDIDQVADVGLTPMRDHGGPTRTIDLESDSEALGRGLAGDCPAYDQRGEARWKVIVQACDSGAVERSTSPPDTPIFADGFEQGNDDAWSS